MENVKLIGLPCEIRALKNTAEMFRAYMVDADMNDRNAVECICQAVLDLSNGLRRLSALADAAEDAEYTE